MGLPLQSIWKIAIGSAYDGPVTSWDCHAEHLVYMLQDLHQLLICFWKQFKLLILISV